jgi:hypothetical protein
MLRGFKNALIAIVVAVSGLLYFVISLPMMMPLRMWEEPLANYNLFYGSFLLIVFGAFLYLCATAEKLGRGYFYGFFAAILAWQLFGELASIPVNEGIVTQFSSVNIKLIGGYFYLLGLLLVIKILWRTGAIKPSIGVFGLTFCMIWGFELYMDNYSMLVDIENMPKYANMWGIAGVVITIVCLLIAWKATKPETRILMGIIMYISLTLMMLGFGQWKKPQKFYVEHEAVAIDKELKELEEEKQKIEELRQWMIADGMIKDPNAKKLTAEEMAAMEDEPDDGWGDEGDEEGWEDGKKEPTKDGGAGEEENEAGEPSESAGGSQ